MKTCATASSNQSSSKQHIQCMSSLNQSTTSHGQSPILNFIPLRVAINTTTKNKDKKDKQLFTTICFHRKLVFAKWILSGFSCVLARSSS